MTIQNDVENLSKAVHSSEFLCDELHAIIKSENLVLSDVALDLMSQAAQLNLRIKRLLDAVQQSHT